jgi:hypothetical protein
LISAFLVVHIAATIVWVLPASPMRARFFPWAQRYIVPLGMWHIWTMFAPDPPHEFWALEADVVDHRGLRTRFAFPRCLDYSWWQAVPRFRYAKYVANVLEAETNAMRKIAARHAVRQLAIPSTAFPVDVHLMLQSRPTPPPGSSADVAIGPISPSLISTLHFASLSEVMP